MTSMKSRCSSSAFVIHNVDDQFLYEYDLVFTHVAFEGQNTGLEYYEAHFKVKFIIIHRTKNLDCTEKSFHMLVNFSL